MVNHKAWRSYEAAPPAIYWTTFWSLYTHRTTRWRQARKHKEITSVLPGIMGFPVKSSARMQPALHKSTAAPYWEEPSRSSGGLYHRVTTRLVRGWWFLGLKTVASPKSPILRFPLLSIRRLAPLISRCRTPRLWQWSRPQSNCRMKHLIYTCQNHIHKSVGNTK